jgi:hypothetical protein
MDQARARPVSLSPIKADGGTAMMQPICVSLEVAVQYCSLLKISRCMPVVDDDAYRDDVRATGHKGKRPLPGTRSFDDQHSGKLLLQNLFCV